MGELTDKMTKKYLANMKLLNMTITALQWVIYKWFLKNENIGEILLLSLRHNNTGIDQHAQK